MEKQILDDVIAEAHGYSDSSERMESLIGQEVVVGKCFEGEGHEGMKGKCSGIDGDFHIIDFPNGDWCMATEIELKD